VTSILKKARQQQVGEDVNHRLWNAAGERDFSESRFQAPEAVTFIDLAPLLPSDNRVSVDQNDLPHLLLAGERQSCRAHSFGTFVLVLIGLICCGAGEYDRICEITRVHEFPANAHVRALTITADFESKLIPNQ
jgi:hypothetical protein